jgi:hypothetical protein
MPNDAKLGLVVGVGLVVAFAVVFFHKEPGAAGAPDRPAVVVPAAPAESPRPDKTAGRSSAKGEGRPFAPGMVLTLPDGPPDAQSLAARAPAQPARSASEGGPR